METTKKWEAVKMKRRWSYAIPITLLLIIGGLAIDCAGLSSTTNSPSSTLGPPSSSYPADIIGRVTLARNVIAGNKQWMPGNKPGDNAQFWIIEVSVKNKRYQSPVTSESTAWMVSTGPSYSPLAEPFASPPASIPKGQSGEMIFCFEVFGNLNPNDYQISYLGQQPYSYGQLVNTDTAVEVYDWDSKKIVDTFPININGKIIQLKVIQTFTGDNTKIVDFTTDKSPVVVAWWTTPTSQIQSSFHLSWQSEVDNTIGSEWWTVASSLDTCQILEGTGKYRLKIESSGCSWLVKVGVEVE